MVNREKPFPGSTTKQAQFTKKNPKTLFNTVFPQILTITGWGIKGISVFERDTPKY
jgi:hypothetical protein